MIPTGGTVAVSDTVGRSVSVVHTIRRTIAVVHAIRGSAAVSVIARRNEIITPSADGGSTIGGKQEDEKESDGGAAFRTRNRTGNL